MFEIIEYVSNICVCSSNKSVLCLGCFSLTLSCKVIGFCAPRHPAENICTTTAVFLKLLHVPIEYGLHQEAGVCATDSVREEAWAGGKYFWSIQMFCVQLGVYMCVCICVLVERKSEAKLSDACDEGKCSSLVRRGCRANRASVPGAETFLQHRSSIF